MRIARTLPRHSRLAAALPLLIACATVLSSAQAPRSSQKYIGSVNRALHSKSDLWGNEALALPDGPTLASLRGRLHPLMRISPLYSEDGIAYLPFGLEDRPDGAADFALHYLDGSEIVSRWAAVPPALIPPFAPPWAGERTSFFVGASGSERYGRSLPRLRTPTLAGGYLPILQTVYTDASGVTWREESFASRIPQTRSLVSFIRFTISGPGVLPQPAVLRLHFARVSRTTPSRLLNEPDLALHGNAVVNYRGRRFLLFSGSPELRGSDLIFHLTTRAGHPRHIYFIRLNCPGSIAPMQIGRAGYQKARARLTRYWNARLASGAQFRVPENYAMDAQRNLLIQNLLFNSRYSIGNSYEVHYNAEGHQAIEVLGLFGFSREYRVGLDHFLLRQSANFEKGERLWHGAEYYFLTHDRSFLQAHDALYRQFMNSFVAEMAQNHGLLRREIAGTDIGGNALHYNIDHQAVVWRGWRDMLAVWSTTGHADWAAEYRPWVQRLRQTLLREALAAAHRYPDGALYIPDVVREKGDPGPFDPLAATKQGAYWLLTAPEGFSTEMYSGPDENSILRYIQNYGGTLMGMLRFNYASTPVGSCRPHGLPGYETQGVDNAYLPAYIRMLADNGQRDQLVLSFYGKLAAGMSPNTFLAGEGEDVGVCTDPAYINPDGYYRTMYLSPNGTNNAAYLLALRLMLVRESQDNQGLPKNLYLADATPRPWLANGKGFSVSRAPTFFGLLSYSVSSHLRSGYIDVLLDVPSRNPVRTLSLRLRTPGHLSIRSVAVNGKRWSAFDSRSETINLSGLRGRQKIRVTYDDARLRGKRQPAALR